MWSNMVSVLWHLAVCVSCQQALYPYHFTYPIMLTFQTSRCRSQWPRGLKRGSAVARLLRLRVRIRPRSWMSVCYDCCVLSCRGLCDELITRPEESYRMWCFVVCDLETFWMRSPWPTGGELLRPQNKQTKKHHDTWRSSSKNSVLLLAFLCIWDICAFTTFESFFSKGMNRVNLRENCVVVGSETL